MNLMELQSRFRDLREAFAVALGKHKERILGYLEGKLMIFFFFFGLDYGNCSDELFLDSYCVINDFKSLFLVLV